MGYIFLQIYLEKKEKTNLLHAGHLIIYYTE